MSNNHPTTLIHHTLRSAEKMRKQLRDRRIALRAMMDALKRHGILRGSLHQQTKREDYTVWYFNRASCDCPDGKRQRIYLGNDQQRIDVAKRSIERAAKYDKLAREMRAVEKAAREFHRALMAAVEMAEYETRRW